MPIETLYRNEHCEWIDVESPAQKDLDFLHEKYGIDPLFLEDTIDSNHLPKYEGSNDVKFFLMRENIKQERVSLNISDISTKLGIFLMEDIIITIHRMKNRSIYEMKEEIYLLQEEISPDTLALKLALKVMKSFDEESARLLETMDKTETEIFLKNTNNSTLIRQLYRLKRKAGLSARILNISADWIDKFKMLKLGDSEITDLKDKHKDVVADFEHLSSQITNLISMFLAMSDQKANQVMKILAIYSMYFLPITFIAGVYGMNFDIMPELKLPYGYFLTLGLMGAIVIITFLYVRRKKW